MLSRLSWFALCPFVPVIAFASSFEHCPAIASIQSQSEVYTAPTVNGRGEWVGIVPAASRGPVRSFTDAVFYPSSGRTDGAGKLGKCSYRLDTGILDLAFKPDRTPLVTVHTPQWQRHDGPFGIVYFRCSVADPTLCRFREALRDSARKARVERELP